MLENTTSDPALPHCPILGKPVRRLRKPAGEVEVSCTQFDVATGCCRLHLDTLRAGRLNLLLAVLDDVDNGEGMQCVMQ